MMILIGMLEQAMTTLPRRQLRRIVGVFGDLVKLIKSSIATTGLLGTDRDYLGNRNNYYWNASTANGGTRTNNWMCSWECEWTIIPCSSGYVHALYVDSIGFDIFAYNNCSASSLLSIFFSEIG